MLLHHILQFVTGSGPTDRLTISLELSPELQTSYSVRFSEKGERRRFRSHSGNLRGEGPLAGAEPCTPGPLQWTRGPVSGGGTPTDTAKPSVFAPARRTVVAGGEGAGLLNHPTSRPGQDPPTPIRLCPLPRGQEAALLARELVRALPGELTNFCPQSRWAFVSTWSLWTRLWGVKVPAQAPY